MKKLVITIVIIGLIIGSIVLITGALGSYSAFVMPIILLALILLVKATAPAINKKELEDAQRRCRNHVVFKGCAHEILQKHWIAYQTLSNPQQSGVSTSYNSNTKNWQLMSGNTAYNLYFVLYLENDPVAIRIFQQHRYYSLFTVERDNVYSLEMNSPSDTTIDMFTTILADIFAQKGNQVEVHQLAEKW